LGAFFLLESGGEHTAGGRRRLAEATVVPKLQSLGFEAVRIGENWSRREIDATVAAYFEMLRLEAKQEKSNKSKRDAVLRRLLKGRRHASVELKHQKISVVLHRMYLPLIAGYKPPGNSQLLSGFANF
jgi:hypothetical protein